MNNTEHTAMLEDLEAHWSRLEVMLQQVENSSVESLSNIKAAKAERKVFFNVFRDYLRKAYKQV